MSPPLSPPVSPATSVDVVFIAAVTSSGVAVLGLFVAIAYVLRRRRDAAIPALPAPAPPKPRVIKGSASQLERKQKRLDRDPASVSRKSKVSRV